MGDGVAAVDAFNTGKLVADELGTVPIARIAVVMPAVYYLVNLIVERVNADQLRAVGHQFRVDWHDAQNGITPPPYHGPSGFSTVSLVVGVLALAGVIVACVWQHRAASAGRALGMPSRRSPPGASVHGSCRWSTCGCRTPPSATVYRRATPTAHESYTGGSPGSSPPS